jgi:hypothetical protein
MDDPQSRTTQVEADKRQSVAEAVERLFAGATDALNRAANCNDLGWQKFHLSTAAAYKEWAVRMEPLVEIQARIDEQVAMFRRRFNLPRPARATRKPDTYEPEEIITAPETVETSSDLATKASSGRESADVEGQAVPSTPGVREPEATLTAAESLEASSVLSSEPSSDQATICKTCPRPAALRHQD